MTLTLYEALLYAKDCGGDEFRRNHGIANTFLRSHTFSPDFRSIKTLEMSWAAYRIYNKQPKAAWWILHEFTDEDFEATVYGDDTEV